MSKDFADLLSQYDPAKETKRVGVVWAGESHVLEAAARAYETYGVEPVLIGQVDVIDDLLAQLGVQEDFRRIPAETPEEATDLALDLVRSGEVDILIKGLMQTATIMRAVVNKDKGIRQSQVLSHATILEIPGHHKLVCLTDGGLLPYPTKEQKVEMIRSAVKLMQATGVAQPKVAILAAVETVNPKMPITVEAAELKEMNQRGDLPGCIVEGPISYDLAMDPEAGPIKGYDSPVAGDADILVVPDLQAGNMLAKALIYSAGAVSAGLIIGAAVPIIITSRSAPVSDKVASISVAAALGRL